MRPPSSKVVAFNLAAVLVVLLLAEAAVRIALPRNAPFDERPSFGVAFRTSGAVSFFTVPDQTIHEVEDGRIRPDRVRYRIDDHGYRGDGLDPAQEPGTIRIAVVGGSHVFDQNSYEWEGNPGFPRLMQDGFRRNGAAVTVINAGVPGSDTRFHAARVLLDLRHLSPDIVILNSAWNDLKWIARTTPETRFVAAPPMAARNPLLERMGVLDRLLGSSALYRHARDAYWQGRYDVGAEGIIETPDPDAADLARGLDQYAANVVAFVQVVRGSGATPVLALQERLVAADNGPAARERIGYGYVNVRTHDELVALFESVDSITRSIAAEFDVPLLDAAAGMEGELRFFDDHVHTTPEGSRRIARDYVRFLRPLVEARLGDPGRGVASR